MSWFGWLTKGHYEVSFLDRLTFTAEALAVGIVGLCLGLSVEWIKRRFK